jgi:heat shock protein HtpX
MNRAPFNEFKTAVLFLTPGALLAVFGNIAAGWAGLAVCAASYTLFVIFAFLSADRMILRQHCAEYISEEQAPGLHALMTELARRAMLPAPALYLLPGAAPQLLVTGANPHRGAIALSKGLLELLSRDELAAAIAHAIAHLRSGETRPMAMAAGLARGLISISKLHPFLEVPIKPLAAAMIRVAVYPSRQFRADETSARLIGDANPLCTALRKIAAHTPMTAPRSASPATAHLFLCSPASGDGPRQVFSTHPPVTERLRKLEALAARPVISNAWLEVGHANK